MLLKQTGQNQSNMKGVTITMKGAPYTKCMELGWWDQTKDYYDYSITVEDRIRDMVGLRGYSTPIIIIQISL